jgi:hypothetical protein
MKRDSNPKIVVSRSLNSLQQAGTTRGKCARGEGISVEDVVEDIATHAPAESELRDADCIETGIYELPAGDAVFVHSCFFSLR